VVRRHVEPGKARDDLEWGREHVCRLTGRNPDLRVYPDARRNQDRLMLRRLRLGKSLQPFIRRILQP
jgi:hypothetical protein